MMWLKMRFLKGKITLQRILYLLAFLTYGIGDGVTAVYMMEKAGPMQEINPVIRLVYIYTGGQGTIILKTWFTFLILSFVWFISRREKNYWMINGFLFSLFIGGIMAMRANITAGTGMMPPSAVSIVMTFLFLTVLFVTIGDEMDKLIVAKRVRGAYERRATGNL